MDFPLIEIFYSLLFLALILHIFWMWSAVPTQEDTYEFTAKNKLKKVTVLICARNEASNLKHYLPSILNQKYENFEVLVINHDSTDQTNAELESLKKIYSNLKSFFVSATTNEFQGKKQALYEGFKKADGEIILITDADCKTESDQWIVKMVLPFDSDKISFVMSYAPYHHKKGWLNTLIQYETVTTFWLMQVFNKIGMAYMATGRNMAVRKSIVKEDYWKKYRDLAFGDDDLMIQFYRNKQNVVILSDKDTFMTSAPKENWSSWRDQKIRHLQAGKHYKKEIVLLLGLYQSMYLIQLVALICLIPCIIKNIILIYLSIPLWFMYWIQYKSICNEGKREFGFWKYLIIQPLIVFYYLIAPILSGLYKKNIWQRNTPYQ